MKVVYIISQRRSGSTLIENLLGQHAQVVSIGEFRLLKGHYLKKGPGHLWDWKCNCGEAIKDCSFWSEHYLQNDANLVETSLRYQISVTEKIQMLFGKIGGIIKKTNEKGNTIALRTLNIFEKIANVNPDKLIVDSSKDALQGYYLAKESDEVSVIYLKRQLRATVCSKYKRTRKNEKSSSLMALLIGSFLNEVFNLRVVDLLPKHKVIRVDYSDFVRRKEQHYQGFLKKFELMEQKIPASFQPYSSHSIAGTPGRFDKRPIVYDESWKSFYRNKPIANFTGWILEKLIK